MQNDVAVTAWTDTNVVDLRTPPPAPEHLRSKVEALIEAVALAPESSDAPHYLPEDFLAAIA